MKIDLLAAFSLEKVLYICYEKKNVVFLLTGLLVHPLK